MKSFIKTVLSAMALGSVVMFANFAHADQVDEYGCSGSQKCAQYDSTLYNGA